MAATTLRREEGYGLALAIAAHVGLAAFLLWQPSGAPVVAPPERMTVTISDEVGLTSTSPEPDADAAPDFAPQAGEAQPAPQVEAEPQPRFEPEPLPVPRPVARPEPRPVPRPTPMRPVARPEPRPVPKPTMRPQPRPAPPAPKVAPKAAPKAVPKAAQTAQRPTTQPAGGSRIGADFLKGVSGAQSTGKSPNQSAVVAGPAVQASLASAISREVKPRWSAPQGVDADKLVTILSWNLNWDGSLAGTPRVVDQKGINDANRAQAARHAEQAIRAVQLAAPFDLPEQYYDAWKRVSAFTFDKRLSQ